ncbi:MAG: Calx-beta domain-containing protein, partial [Anaerolineae bacterium]
IDDAVSEADEQFSVNVSATAGSSVLIPDSTIAVTIQDNDDAPVPNLSAADLTVNEGSSVATVQINLDVASAQNLEINYQTFAEVAISPDDYTAVTGVLTIPAGTQTASFDIPIVDDVDAELNEYFFVRLTTADASVLKIKNPELVVTIVDNDEILLFAGNSNGQAVRVVEDEGIAFVDISLNRPATAEVQVDVSTQNLLAMSPSDYTAVPPTTLVFAPGEVRKTVEIAIIDDAASFEGLERFRLKVENLVNATLHGQAFAEVVIIDNDNPAPFIYFEFADYSIYEDMDNNPATASELDVVVKLSNPSASTITVTVKSIDNASSATTPEDYTAINQIVTIPAGQREAVVTVSVNEDDIPERQETFALRFFDTSSGVIVDPTQNSTTVTIADGTPPVMRLNHTFITTSFTENNQMAVELVLSGNVVLPVRFGVQSFQEAGIKRHLSVSGFGSALRVFKLEPGTARFRLSFSTPTTHGQDAGSTFSNDPFDLAEIIIVDGAHGLYSPNRVEPSVRPYTFFMPIMFGK